MSDLKQALLDAKYVDMISLGDFVVRDCGLPDVDAEGNLMPQASEIAAALFRWAADVPAGSDNTARAAAGADQSDQSGGDKILPEAAAEPDADKQESA
ncbi:hypothetical protein [Tropicibacter naphthalenivorans]|uniref:NADH dehydrogenase subunit I n=1 Tax=Tropicibacter naphthalenivorans TaxID=441103 RepID=A0A0P1GZG2_9RHOB|nr:hypothetical protein [Tropicibacter naphthalenivorans]CUH80307.1 hypothetical protein TRN7648_02921 [Tropicibacter naphthalenivorans]SMC85786.1 hypothetical protein SAMN04488093_105190 [Tropicibacter naphthalenivorans]